MRATSNWLGNYNFILIIWQAKLRNPTHIQVQYMSTIINLESSTLTLAELGYTSSNWSRLHASIQGPGPNADPDDRRSVTRHNRLHQAYRRHTPSHNKHTILDIPDANISKSQAFSPTFFVTYRFLSSVRCSFLLWRWLEWWYGRYCTWCINFGFPR